TGLHAASLGPAAPPPGTISRGSPSSVQHSMPTKRNAGKVWNSTAVRDSAPGNVPSAGTSPGSTTSRAGVSSGSGSRGETSQTRRASTPSTSVVRSSGGCGGSSTITATPGSPGSGTIAGGSRNSGSGSTSTGTRESP